VLLRLLEEDVAERAAVPERGETLLHDTLLGFVAIVR
jgi:hypothetical protein